ncbi:hypothetical protein H257_01326 [Aphanomyces astaci]|uniref:Uncharacterized protein n=1 Tax=Aphanomyces astaci TaxID=112090 RepID=W4H9G1_APHAT|nr:hypothetical protein H257_01326 [Aphanomyces astaci]ETV87919.1 hypothetical protein H257_01326 [Aphanomyces astaci]KAF0754236.1 hypothetical protein AaE_005414 [Aphanomyces astaci]RHY07507.1 hypothetical protein DYB36_011699 [Aphanomyces astaci]RHY11937.1 hypothetical protein DYB25_006568 [Aphanomyces astaci]RHY48262.1 hypothetical protein DYB34_013744 [Aphanomyces astaci]|eukprot:XP_009822782.1 hypothetical protein H257_01326 [Aphanomyces astaci]
MDEEEWSKEQEANRKPGQKHPTPSPGFADRVFYESLLSQNPKSKMAKKWCLEYGVLEWDDAAVLCKELGVSYSSKGAAKKSSEPKKRKANNILDDTVDDTGLHASSNYEGIGIGGV